MSESRLKFTAVPEAPPDAAAANIGTRMIMIGLATLGKRVLTAISDLFSLILVAVVAALAYCILDNPSQTKIVTVFGVAFFCFAIDVIRRRTK